MDHHKFIAINGTPPNYSMLASYMYLPTLESFFMDVIGPQLDIFWAIWGKQWDDFLFHFKQALKISTS